MSTDSQDVSNDVMLFVPPGFLFSRFGLAWEFISNIHKNAPDILRQLYLCSRPVQMAILAQAKIIKKIADNGKFDIILCFHHF